VKRATNLHFLMRGAPLAIASAVLFAAASFTTSAWGNVAGGGTGQGPDVTLRDEGAELVLDNGIVSIRINKADATIPTFRYRGVNLFANGHNGGRFYWSWNAPAYGGPRGQARVVVNPATNHGAYAEVVIHSPWSGQPGEAAMDMDVHYSLTRGAQGFYAATLIEHPATYPALDLGEFRSNAYVSPIFDWLSVDALRQRKMPSVEDMAASLPVAGAPKEVRVLTTGPYAGQFECKYAYSADLGDLDVWGWSSTSHRMGIWMTVPSREYYNGGPMKRELTVHMDHTLLNMLNGSHYGMGDQLKVAAGRHFQKTFGPYLIYANSYQGQAEDDSGRVVNALWQDAKAQAAAEQAAWPYAWFGNAHYTPERERGQVSGALVVKDGPRPALAASGAWIGLAPYDQGTDFQLQGRTYQFWVKVGKDGGFNIPHVLPGSYELWAFGAGQIGTFHRAGVQVKAGERLDLGSLAWRPDRVAQTLWDIGIADRDTHEFRDGGLAYTQWATFAKLGDQSGLRYKVGISDWSRDWGYAQSGEAPWTVSFELAEKPAAAAVASLYIGLASAEVPLRVSLNGLPIGVYRPEHPSHAPIRLGSHGAFGEIRLKIPANFLKKGENHFEFAKESKKGGTIQYDYIRMEASGVRLAR